MAITQAQYDNLVQRLDFVEATINNLISAMAHFATLDQVNQLTLIRQTEIDNLNTIVTTLQNQVEALSGLMTI